MTESMTFTERLEDLLAGEEPSRVAATLEVAFRGRALLERDTATRRAWKKLATAVGRVSFAQRVDHLNDRRSLNVNE